jgi:hypothetical protein
MAFGRVLIVICVCLGLTACGSGSDDTVRDFFQSLAAGDSDKALSHFAPDLYEKFKPETLRSQADHWTEVIRQHGGLKEIELSGGVVTYNALAYYTATLVFQDGKRRAIHVTLTYVGGTWYINAAV